MSASTSTETRDSKEARSHGNDAETDAPRMEPWLKVAGLSLLLCIAALFMPSTFGRPLVWVGMLMLAGGVVMFFLRDRH